MDQESNYIETVPQNLQRKNIFVLSQSQIKDVLGNSSFDTSIKKVDQENPLEEAQKKSPPQDIADPSDQQLENMNQINQLQGDKKSQTPMETKQPEQILGPPVGEKGEAKVAQKSEKDISDKQVENEKKDENAKKNIAGDCQINVDDGIMNCENDKNQIRQDEVDIKDIEQDVSGISKYEISLYCGLILCGLIILVLLLARFRSSMSKYLEKYYIKSLRIIILDVIILMSLNTLVQILYYNRFLDVIQLEYFNIYGFTITFAFFSIFWILIATIYAYILQNFSNTYMLYERNWIHRMDYLEVDPEDETEAQFEERLKNIQYFLIKEDFIMPITHICYTEPMVLREDFNFAEYLGRAQAKCHLQLFNISLTTLIILITFFLIVTVIDLIEDWLIECLIFLLLPLISFIVGWIENKRQLIIVQQLITTASHQYEIESIKFLNLDLKRQAHFSNKIKYPSYIQDQHVYTEEATSRHQSLFPFRAVQFPLKLVHFTLVLQIVWIMVFLFNYSKQLTKSWECQVIFSIGLFLILFQLFFVIPFFLKKYAVNTHIQQLKDPQIIEKVVSNQKEQITLAFQKLYRLIKHLRRQNNPKRNHIKLRPEIIEQLKQIEQMKLKSIDQLIHKLGYLNYQNDEFYYLEKALLQIQQSNSSQPSSQASLEHQTKYNLDGNNEKNQKEKEQDQEQVENPRPTANPRNQGSILPQKTHLNKPEGQEEQKDENDSLVNLSEDLINQNKGEQDKDLSLVDIEADEINKKSSIDKQDEESVKIEIDLRDSTEKKAEQKDSDKNKQNEKNVDQNMSDGSIQLLKKKSIDEKQQEEQSRFVLSVLLKLCSVYTQEVVLDPYKASYETLLEMFNHKQIITIEEFKKIITQQYNKIEQEQLDIILDKEDIKLIVNEVFYLEDKYEKIHISRVASLLRNSIEMLPR
ncbi:transmembrane protein, putative (macronuclear) [Tetrahymena thermophila SB210]|uniref:Transmembrane protein, putative n=1 Tax=Tetrahymena thermophila (strain SB210) TaxID=312017 RepID=Q232M4_TETTS|nr:transmembrane protein, putative [Tetrahymena thermophila SB210]EAR91388.2 transmembrane protein, putative [Tetrahymena thermophila SB210]|eukprot:XP_001011633.2 transmembrane protein, putative [Tetrahymena thermophila SB210]